MSPRRFASIGRSARGVRVVLGVAGLVEERLPVVAAADRLDHEHHAARHLDRRAERARALARPLLEVEVDVLLRAQVDAEVARASPRARAASGRTDRPCPTRAPGRGAATSHGRASARPIPSRSRKSAVARLLPQALGRVEQLRALRGELVEPEAEALVELVVVRRAELRRRPRGRSAPRRGRPGSAARRAAAAAPRSSRCAPVAVGLVRERRRAASGTGSARRRRSPRARPRPWRASPGARA